MEDRMLKPFKPSDIFWRGLYGIECEGSQWIVEVDYFDISETIAIYRDGLLVASGKSPFVYDVSPSVRIEADMALYGMKRVHLVETQTDEKRQLCPLPGTAECRRKEFEVRHPIANGVIAFVAWSVLAVALVTQAPNLANTISNLLGPILPFATYFSMPSFALPDWANCLLGILGIVAGIDRGLRMKHNALLDD